MSTRIEFAAMFLRIMTFSQRKATRYVGYEIYLYHMTVINVDPSYMSLEHLIGRVFQKRPNTLNGDKTKMKFQAE
jgi:hypothetical protein